jgi:hypothetical protein
VTPPSADETLKKPKSSKAFTASDRLSCRGSRHFRLTRGPVCLMIRAMNMHSPRILTRNPFALTFLWAVLAASALLSGCSEQGARAALAPLGLATSHDDSASPLASGAAINIEIIDSRSDPFGRPSLEGLDAQLDGPLSVRDSGEPRLVIQALPGPLGALRSTSSAPLFHVDNQGSSRLARARLRIPYDAERTSPKGARPSVVRLMPNNTVALVEHVEIDSSNGWASFVADIPGDYLAVPHGFLVLGAKPSP